MDKVETKTLTLRVAEALGKDVGRAMARLDPQDMTRIGAEARDRKYSKEVLLSSEVEGTTESSYRNGILEIKLRKRK